jgi:hypothetical protein
MAEDQTPKVEAPADAPEPDIGGLLAGLPEFGHLFSGAKSGEPPEQSKEPAPEEKVPAVAEPESTVPQEPAAPEPEPAQPEPVPKEEEPTAVQKRIDELTAKRKTAEERVALLEAENNDLKAKYAAPPPLAPSPKNPLADIENETDLAKKVDLVQQAKTWAFQNLDGGEVDYGNGQKEFMDGRRVKELYAQADLILSKHVPAKKEFLHNRAIFDAEAKKVYPNLFKAGTEENKILVGWQTVLPECRNVADLALIVGDALSGQKMRLSGGRRGNGSANGQPQPLAAPAPASSPRVPANKALSGEALSAIATDQTGQSYDAWIEQLIEQGRAARDVTRK